MITLPMDKKTFRHLREHTGLTRDEMAIALSVTERMAQHYENGTWPIPNKTAKLMIMFAKHGVPPDFWVTSEES